MKYLSNPERSKYRKWRLKILLTAMIGYAAYYIVRQNFSLVMPILINTFGVTKTELGWAVMVFNVIYGFGKLINGFFSDRSNARYFMTFGLSASALMSIMMGFSRSVYVLMCLYALSGWFQSMGWPPVARMLTQWFTPRELGMKWAIASTGHQLGGAAIYASGPFIIALFGWCGAFFVPGIFSLSIALVLSVLLRDSPKDLALPAPEAYKGEKLPHDNQHRIQIKEVAYIIFYNPMLWCISMANMCLYVVRLGIMTWAPTFLYEMKKSTLVNAGLQVTSYEITGVFGGILAGWLSDKFFNGRRGPVGCFYMCGLALALLYFWKTPAGHGWANGIALSCVGFLVYGPQVLIGVASADFASKRAVGVANGFAGTFAYVGVGMSHLAIGWISDHLGWDYGFIFFIIASLLGVVFFALTWNQGPRVSHSMPNKTR